MKTFRKWALRILGVIVILVTIGAGYLMQTPVPTDPFIADEDAGTGSIAVKSSISGLLREFPESNAPSDNPTHAAAVELGRNLFYDPILSANDDTSCATCHHPDLGFSNGQASAAGRSGRNVPTLWNVQYNQFLLWDGSMESLEDQALTPLTHADEMAADLDTMVTELNGIAAYRDLFGDAFDDGEISSQNITYALAQFQRSLITQNSAFDRYAAGEKDALTPAQRRGLALFRSGATRCFECHTAPTFASDTFRVVGVPSEDPGRAGVSEDGVNGAFNVPTLRNIALTAPYMHNGSMATLEEVIDFYADGGGRAHDMENIDPFVQGFEATVQERTDMVAFMHSLTDERNLPAVPGTALSGLPAVTRVNNAARILSKSFNTVATGGFARGAREAMTVTVDPSMDIQALIDEALPGDTIEFAYGTYNIRIASDVNNLTFRGIPNADGDYPVFDGQNKLPEAFIISGNDFEISHLKIQNYTNNGLLVEGVEGVHIHDLETANTGTYGIYPTKSTDVLVEDVIASGVNDAGIYAGQNLNVIIRNSVAYDSVIGIELENTINGVAHDNHLYDNSLGILVVVLPQLSSKVSRDSVVYNNIIENNNRINDGPPGSAVALVPPGVGILSLAADDVEIYNNTLRGNKTTGVAIFSLEIAYSDNEIDVGPNPENNRVYNNTYENNGYDPDKFVADLGIPVGDTLWDGSGWGNTFDETDYNPGFPVVNPREGWSMRLRRLHWHSLNYIVGLVE